MLPLATSQLMGDSMEFGASCIFLGFLLIVGGLLGPRIGEGLRYG